MFGLKKQQVPFFLGMKLQGTEEMLDFTGGINQTYVRAGRKRFYGSRIWLGSQNDLNA